MKTYPHTTTRIVPMHTYVFDKLDGSNIRAEWSPKKGFYKFGSRHRLLGEDQGIIWNAKQMILDKYGTYLDGIFRNQRYERAVAYFEFYGQFSFAGSHEDNDKHDVVLFDVAPFKKGILLPKDFLKLFGHLDTPKLLHTGRVTHDLFDEIKDGTLEGMTHEGVMCKGTEKGKVYMYKVKSRKWLQQLRDYCGNDAKLYKRLL